MTGLLVLLLATATILLAQEDYPPGTVHLTPEIDLQLRSVPLVVPQQFRDEIPDDLSVNLPAGFSASVFAATGLHGPRLMAWNPDGVLHVANAKVGNAGEFEARRAMDDGVGQIVALPDRNRDGVADAVEVVADGLWWVNSLSFSRVTSTPETPIRSCASRTPMVMASTKSAKLLPHCPSAATTRARSSSMKRPASFMYRSVRPTT